MNKKHSIVLVVVGALCATGYSGGIAKNSGGSAGVAASTASVGETVQVKGKGVGTTQESALKDAYRSAVEAAVGLYVDAEQMMKNDEVIKDQILTQSNAYIEKYEIKGRSEREGLIEIVIWAQVRKQELAKKIKAVMPSQSVQVGNTLANIHAVNETIEKRSADGASLLQNALNDFHPSSALVDFKLMSSEPVVAQPRFPKRGGGGDGIAYPFFTQINMDRYQQVVVERLKPVLSQISLTQPQRVNLPIVMGGHPDVNVMRERMQSSKKHRKGEGPNMVCSISAPRVKGRSAQGPLRLEQPYNCLLVTGINSAGTMVECEMYQLDDAARSAFGQWVRYEKGPQYRVIFKGEDGSALYQETMKASFCDCYEVSGGFNPRSIMFAPWSLRGHNSVMSVGEWRTVNVPREVQPNVRSITVEQIQ